MPLVRSNNLINNQNSTIRPSVNSSLVGQYNPRNNNNNNANAAQSSLMGGGPPGIIPNPSTVIRNNQNQQQNNIYSKSNIQNGQQNSIMGKRPPVPGMIGSNPNLSTTNPAGLLPMNRQPVNNSSGPGLLNNPTRIPPMQNQYYNNTPTSNPQMNMMMNHRPGAGIVNQTTPNAPNPNMQQQFNYMMQQQNQPAQQPTSAQMNGLPQYAQQQSQNPVMPQPQPQPYGQPYGQPAGMMPTQTQPTQPIMPQQHPSQLANTQPNLIPSHLSHLQDPYSSYRNVDMTGHLSAHNTHPHYPHPHQMATVPPNNPLKMNDLEFQEALEKNRIVSSTAISRAVQDASMGQYASAIETLVTAISLIKQSKIANDERCKIFVSSLLDTKKGIEDKYYGAGASVVGRSGMVMSGGGNMIPTGHGDSRDSRDRDRYYNFSLISTIICLPFRFSYIDLYNLK